MVCGGTAAARTARDGVVSAGAAGVGFGACSNFLGFGLGRLRRGDVLSDLRVIEREPVLGRQDAAQQLDDVDLHAALRGCRRLGLVPFAGGLVDGVELERIERRDRSLIGLGDRREAPHDAHIGLGMNVLAPGKPLLQ